MGDTDNGSPNSDESWDNFFQRENEKALAKFTFTPFTLFSENHSYTFTSALDVITFVDDTCSRVLTESYYKMFQSELDPRSVLSQSQPLIDLYRIIEERIQDEKKASGPNLFSFDDSGSSTFEGIWDILDNSPKREHLHNVEMYELLQAKIYTNRIAHVQALYHYVLRQYVAELN